MWDERLGLRFWLNTSLTFVFVFSPLFLLSLSVFIFCHSLSAGTRPQATSETSSSLHTTSTFFCLPPDDKDYTFVPLFYFQFFPPCTCILSPSSSCSLLISNFHALYFLHRVFPHCSTHSILLSQSSVFYACIPVLPMYFSFCSLIYFSIFIIHHLPVNLLSPHSFLRPCLCERQRSNFAAFHIFFSSVFSPCTYPECITQCITIWFYPPEPPSLSGCLATANIEFNLRRGRLLPERQMVRGWGKRCWEIHPLTSTAHSVILSVLSLYFRGFMSEWERGARRQRRRGEYGGYVGVFSRWQQQPLCSEAYFTTYLHILKPSCNIAFPVLCCCLLPLSPIFCLIVIHVQSVCLANLLAFRPSQQSYFMSVCHRVYFVLSFVLSASP